MEVVYTAGPFTAQTPWDVECNVMQMRALSLEVARLGAMPLCPHANTSLFVGQCTPEFWYAGTLELLTRCDAVVMHHAWRDSAGSRAERDYALAHGMPLFYADAHHGLKLSGFAEWLEERGSASSQSFDDYMKTVHNMAAAACLSIAADSVPADTEGK